MGFQGEAQGLRKWWGCSPLPHPSVNHRRAASQTSHDSLPRERWGDGNSWGPGRVRHVGPPDVALCGSDRASSLSSEHQPLLMAR